VLVSSFVYRNAAGCPMFRLPNRDGYDISTRPQSWRDDGLLGVHRLRMFAIAAGYEDADLPSVARKKLSVGFDGGQLSSEGRAGQAEMPFPRWAVDRTEDCRRPRAHRRGDATPVMSVQRRRWNAWRGS
jgi:hypothetical protein